jgi:hypothetical protein
MTTLDVYRFEYKINRRFHGPIVSAFLAVRVALAPIPF